MHTLAAVESASQIAEGKAAAFLGLSSGAAALDERFAAPAQEQLGIEAVIVVEGKAGVVVEVGLKVVTVEIVDPGLKVEADGVVEVVVVVEVAVEPPALEPLK